MNQSFACVCVFLHCFFRFVQSLSTWCNLVPLCLKMLRLLDGGIIYSNCFSSVHSNSDKQKQSQTGHVINTSQVQVSAKKRMKNMVMVNLTFGNNGGSCVRVSTGR